jgi:peptide chain release factor 2
MAVRDHVDALVEERRRLGEAQAYLKLDSLRRDHERLQEAMSDPALWDDADRARKVGAQFKAAEDDITTLDSLAGILDDADTLVEMGMEAGDESVEPEIVDLLGKAKAGLDELELRSLFTGDYEEGDAIFEIHSGAGGVDAQDWAEMMLRMYTRWAERRGFQVEIDEVVEANEAGINTAILTIRGRYAYGLLSAERGVHRLVRISPFDSQARRQTSFAGVSVTPVIEDAVSKVNIDEKDLRVDVFRSSGAGGQHINTTDSAVRITHLPTGFVVSCQIERSQIQNRVRAMDMLAAKLIELARQERENKLATLTGPQKDAAWGNQIRSYVLAPYQLVKDLRSNYETGNVSDVLDGDLDDFMEAWLRWRRAESIQADAASL